MGVPISIRVSSMFWCMATLAVLIAPPAAQVPARIHERLERLARDEHVPQWRIVVAALLRYDTHARRARKET